MKIHQHKNRRLPILLLIFGLTLVLLFFAFNYFKPKKIYVKNHVSNGVHISFQYPSDWFIDDRYREVQISNYQTDLNTNDKPTEGQIKINLKNESICHDTIEKELLLGNCTDKQEQKVEITDKTMKEFPNGTFSKYTIRYTNLDPDQEITLYYLQKGDRILQISKEPNNSQFEEEFEYLIQSIRFLE